MSETTKICTGCRKIKPLDEFYKQNNGRYGYAARCKLCKLEEARLRRAAKLLDTRTCANCQEQKPIVDFAYSSRPARFEHSAGRYTWCRDCHSGRVAEVRAPDADVLAAIDAMLDAGYYAGLRLDKPRVSRDRRKTCKKCEYNALCWRRYSAGAWVMCCDPTASDVCRLHRQLPPRGAA